MFFASLLNAYESAFAPSMLIQFISSSEYCHCHIADTMFSGTA